MYCLLSGGTGTPKLLQAIDRIDSVCIIVNTGEDVCVSGLYVSPDLDTVVYTLAGIIDDTKWYGQKEDTYNCYEMMVSLGYEELLKIGDKDRGLKLYRTKLMKEGISISEITERVLKAFNISTPVFPMSDDRVTTKIFTDTEVLTFHEFWVQRRAQVNVKNVVFEGVEKAEPVRKALDYMKRSEFVFLGPSNPVTSIGPIINIKEYRTLLKKKKVVAISPMIGEAPFSGPTGVLMRGLNFKTNCVGVAEIYKDFCDIFIIHKTDEKYKREIEKMGMTVYVKDILLDSFEKKKDLITFVESIAC
ncbi:MAG: 2-phospho-L-lactate transferase [Theionarchaea archaeon]|nr:2-phospho-L-lactate transferase [Theionarchaea archaeon]